MMIATEKLSKSTRQALYLSAASTLAVVAVAPALAQQTETPNPEWVSTDENGVDLATGRFYLGFNEVVLGEGDGGISLKRFFEGATSKDNWSGVVIISSSKAVVNFGRTSEGFTLQNGAWVADKGNGATLVSTATGAIFMAANGSVVTYTKPEYLAPPPSDPNYVIADNGCGPSGSCAIPVSYTHLTLPTKA